MKKKYTQHQLMEIADDIIANTPSKKLCFYGNMGAGKTTLIKAIVKQLGSNEEVNSPSFGLVNEYQKKDGTLLGYHFDFYRLKNEEEALDFGIEDYLYADAWLFMEWPENISSLLPEDVTNISIEILDENTRMLTLNI